METAEARLLIEISEVDQLCETCGNEITVGEEYIYDESTEEVICQNCANEKDRFE